MTETINTICQMCYFKCGLRVTVDDETILRVEGMPEHPVNKGRLCAKGLSAAQLTTDPDRLKTPLRRTGERGSGEWEPISWDEALNEIAEKLLKIRQAFGPEYVGYYRGQAPGWVTNYNYVIRFMNSWGSPNIFTHGHLCFTPRAIAHAGTFGGYPEPDYERANCIALFGYNPVYTSPVNYAARIIWAKERGAKLIVADPRFTNTASKADLFLQERPGTTGALVLGLIHVIIAEALYDADFVQRWTVGFDELETFIQDYTPEAVASITGVPAAKIKEAARMIATIKPAVVVDGNGLDQHTNTVQTVRTTSILRALIRTVDEPGGSVLVPPLPFVDVQRRGARPDDFADRAVYRYPLYFGAGLTNTGVAMTDAIATEKPHPLKALIVQGGNPVSALSDTSTLRKTLQMTDLLVVHDPYLSSTAQIADIVLPAATFLERDLILYYRYRPSARANLIALQNRCVPPVGESKSDLEFIIALARRVGLGEYFPWDDVKDAFDQELEVHGISVDWLRQHPGGYLREYEPEEIYRQYEQDGFDTPSGKIEFVSSLFARHGYDPLPTFVEPAEGPVSTPELAEDYPMVCSAGLKLGIHTGTQFRSLPWIRAIEPDPFAEIHPRAAAEHGIEDGEWMIVESPRGTIRVRAHVTPSTRPDVIMVTHGYGEPYDENSGLTNDVTGEDERDPIAGATSNRSFLCRIRKADR